MDKNKSLKYINTAEMVTINGKVVKKKEIQKSTYWTILTHNDNQDKIWVSVNVSDVTNHSEVPLQSLVTVKGELVEKNVKTKNNIEITTYNLYNLDEITINNKAKDKKQLKISME